MAEWMVMLKGDAYDLADLAKRFHTSGNKIVLDREDYWLKSSDFSSMASDSDVYDWAVVIIKRINGIARVSLGGGRRSIEIGNVVRVQDDGSRRTFVTLSATICSRTRVTAALTQIDANGQIQAPIVSQFEDCLLALADSDELVAFVLNIYGNEPPDWVNLYRIHEGISKRVGGWPVIMSNGWASSHNQIELFKFSAQPNRVNSTPTNSSKQPKKEVMALAEGQAFINHLVTQWLHSLCP